MARLLSRIVPSCSHRHPIVSRFIRNRSLPSFSVVSHTRHHQQRHRSSHPGKTQLMELDLNSADDVEVEVLGDIQRLEEVINNIIVRRSAPDWLPFRPGSSYWVPPTLFKRAPFDLVQVLGKMALASAAEKKSSSCSPEPLWDDQFMDVGSGRGWPSSAYFIERTGPSHLLPMEVEVEVTVFDNLKMPETEDE